MACPNDVSNRDNSNTSGARTSNSGNSIKYSPNKIGFDKAYEIQKHDMLPIENLVSKLSFIFSIDYSHETLRKISQNRVELGNYDYSVQAEDDRGINSDRIFKWAQLIEPICSLNSVKQKYNLPNDFSKFVQAIYGRQEKSSDREILNQFNSFNGNRKQVLICMSLLMTKEFMGQ